MADFLKGPFEPTPYDSVIEEITPKVLEALTATNEEYGWKPLDHKFPNIKSYSTSLDGFSVPFLKCTTTFPVDIETSRALLAHFKYRGEWDPKFGCYDIVKVFNASQMIVRTQFNAPWPVSVRDFCVLVSTKITEDGKGYIVCGKSIECDDCPETKAVRGTLPIFGYTLLPNAENPQHTDIAYCLCTDPRGSIPNAILKGLVKTLGDVLHGLRANVLPHEKKVAEICASYKELVEVD